MRTDSSASLQSPELPKVVVVLATYNPHREFFLQQIRSLQAQTFSNWQCLILDDASHPESFEYIQSVIQGDSRFSLLQNPKNMGASCSFVRALSLVPEDSSFLAFCDQDDVWHPSKLSEQIRILSGGEYLLTFCDRALIDSAGGLMNINSWIDTRRRDLEPTLEELIFRNTIGGNSMMFDFRVIKAFLPFDMEKRPLFFHDALIATLVAMNGKIHSDARQFVLYRQHENNLVGHSTSFEARKLIHLMKSSRRTAMERIELLQTIQDILIKKQKKYESQLEGVRRLKSVYQNPLKFLIYGLDLCFRRPSFIKHYVLLVLGIIVMKVKPV